MLSDMPPDPVILVAEICGWLFIPLCVLRFQVRDFDRGLILAALAALATSIHLAPLGATSGAIIALAVALSAAGQALVGARLPLSLRLAISGAAIAAALAFREAGQAGLLPLAAFVAMRLAEAVRHDLFLRAIGVGACALWLVYGLASGSPQIAIANAIATTSCLVGLLRYHTSLRIASRVFGLRRRAVPRQDRQGRQGQRRAIPRQA
mgnify:FL=1